MNGGTMATQCLELGRLDEITLDVVPVILGGGTPYVDAAGCTGRPRWPDDHPGEPGHAPAARGAQSLNQRPAKPGADLDFQDT